MKDGKLRMSNTKFMVILIPILVFLLVVAVIVNVAFGIFGPTLDSLFVSTTILSDVPDADKAFEDSKAMAKRVQDEGTVLLKNEDGLLPLADKTKRVNLFGWGSYEPVYSGYGSGGMREQTDMTRFTTMEQAFKEFTAKKLQREERPSIRKDIAASKEKAAARNADRAKEKFKERGLSR